MNRRGLVVFVAGIIACGLLLLLPPTRVAAAKSGTKPASLSTQRNDVAAAQAFESIIPVLHHPRCMSCHSSGDFPRQGDDGHPHIMDIKRGPDGHGANAVRCSTCHQDHNLDGLHMPPGAPDWALPSPSTPMIWEGLSDHQLCELFKDPTRNGHRTVSQIVEHMHTLLVLWGWNPGDGRTPIPMSQHTFLANVEEWANNGAACPVTPGLSPSRGR